MANTRIILNRQSDLKLTGAEILAPIGIEKSDLPGLVDDLQQLQEAINDEVTRAQDKDAEHDNSINQIEVNISSEVSSRISGDESLDVFIKDVDSSRKDGDDALTVALSAEESSRILGDASIQSQIDAIMSGSTVDLDNFSEIVAFVEAIDLQNDASLLAAVNSIENKHDAEVSAETSARVSADLAEQNARIAGDAAVTAAYEAADSVERAARIAGDTSLETRLSIEESTHAVEYSTEVAAREAAVSAEESSRISGDASLELRLSIEESTHAVEYSTEVAAREAAVSAEESSRISGDASLETVINNLNVSNLADLSAEISSRIAGDTSLDAALSAEISRAIEAEGSIATVLSSEVSSIIANTDLTSIDSFAEVVSELDAEESVRLAGDTSLEAEIDALPLTDDVTIEVDGENNIRLKDVVAEGTAGERTFEGLNKAGVQPNTLAGYDDLSFITKGILDAFDTTVTGDVSAEASSRAAADASLELRLSIEESTHAVEYSTEVAAREAAISSEASSRVAADGSLESKINADVSAEESSRILGDASIQSQIDAIMSGSTVDLDTFAEVVAFVEAIDLQNDNSLLAAVNSIETKHDAEVSAETSARILADLNEQEARVAADLSLTTRLAAEESKHAAEYSTEVAAREAAISVEELARISADSSLEDRLSIEESTHAVEYSTEVAARESADASLEVVLSAEISVQNSIDQAIKDGVNAALVEVKDMVINAIKNSAFGIRDTFIGDGTTVVFSSLINETGAIYLNGLLQERNVDYTFSQSVNGKGITVGTFTFNDAPEAGASVMIYGQRGEVNDPNWYRDITPLA